MDSKGGQLTHRALAPLRSRSLRVLLDARKLGEGGIGVYLENLIRGFNATAGEGTSPRIMLSALVRERQIATLQKISPRCEAITTDIEPFSLPELFLLGKQIPQERFDLFHTPHFVLPYFMKIPSVVTVHDLTHIRFPERWYYPVVASRLIRSSLRRSARVITVSESSKRDLLVFVARRKKQAEKIRVVPNAVEDFFLEAPPMISMGEQKGGYFLAVLSMHKPHKGLADLLAAWKRITTSPDTRTLSQDMQLIVAGLGTRQISEDSRLLHDLSETSRIFVRGSVTKEDLRKLYSGAEALIVPSRAEGFGLPMLEAHSCGTPVIFRPVPALEELSMTLDIRCQGFSIDALVEAIQRYLRERGERQKERVRAASLMREEVAARYTIRDTAHATLRVYAEALGIPLLHTPLAPSSAHLGTAAVGEGSLVA